jgi:hypothetical protein
MREDNEIKNPRKILTGFERGGFFDKVLGFALSRIMSTNFKEKK